MRTLSLRPGRLLIAPLLILLFGTCVRAQIRISRQVIATAVWSATPAGNSQQLKLTAHAGEVFVGTKRGDVRATVGFQQPDDDVLVSVVTIGTRRLTVRAFPNPTIDHLTVDLAEAEDLLTELQLLDLHGRVLIRRRVTGLRVEFPTIGQLPGASYYLRGLDAAGRPYALGTILLNSH